MVDTEVYALARDIFQRVRREKPAQTTSVAVGVLGRVPAFSALPATTLDCLASGMVRVDLAAGASALGGVGDGDEWLMVVSQGSLELTRQHADEVLAVGHPLSSSPAPAHAPWRAASTMLSNFIPSADKAPIKLGAASCVGCGRASDELLLASLFTSPHLSAAMATEQLHQEQLHRPHTAGERGSAAPLKRAQTVDISHASRVEAVHSNTPQPGELVPTTVAPPPPGPPLDGVGGVAGQTCEGRGADVANGAAGPPLSPSTDRQLQLLTSTGAGWRLHASAGGSTTVFRLSLRATCAAILEAPHLLARSPLPVRALLQSLPPFGQLTAKELDALSFAFSLISFQVLGFG